MSFYDIISSKDSSFLQVQSVQYYSEGNRHTVKKNDLKLILFPSGKKSVGKEFAPRGSKILSL